MSDRRHQGGEEFELRIRALADDDAPAIIRLRRVLKGLLRTYGFRCISCADTTPQLPPLVADSNADAAGGTDDR